jgi:hypothetical protein
MLSWLAKRILSRKMAQLRAGPRFMWRHPMRGCSCRKMACTQRAPAAGFN